MKPEDHDNVNVYKILYTNADGLLNKLDELKCLTEEKKPDIIAITEYFPKQYTDITMSEIAIPGYDQFTNENPKRGVIVYAKSHLNAKEITDINEENFQECVWISIINKDKKSTLIGCIYKSPNTTAENEEKLFTLIKSKKIEKYDKVCIVGDFNYPNASWNMPCSGTKENKLIDSINDAFLNQMVQKPTRRRNQQKPSLLDLILVNDDDMISDITHHSPIGRSDHDVLIFELYIPKESNIKPTTMSYQLKRGDYKKMRQESKDFNWKVMNDLNTNKSWILFKNKLHELMNNHIPKKQIGNGIRTKPAWMSNRVLKKIRKKYHAYKRYQLTDEWEDYMTYLKLLDISNKETTDAKKDHEKKIAQNCKKDSKKFWKYVRSKTKGKTGISPLSKSDGSLAITDLDKANTLNKFFASVFTIENKNELPDEEPTKYSNGITITDIIITPKAIEDRLKQLDTSKATGPDGIPSKVLKELANELAEPLSILFNKSVNEGSLPDDWKQAHVTAIFKKGSKSEPGNYRPVSLTSIVCKVFESLIRDAIVSHMKDNNLFTNCQHGFRQHRSCVTQLLKVMEDLTKLVDGNEDIDIIYFDFKKAFDTVPHERLLIKLKYYGISGKIVDWIKDFLSNRKQMVRVGNEISGEVEVMSGIPQGSILGPILFTIFINDLPNEIESFCSIFADDTKIYNSASNSSVIQDDIDTLSNWSDHWKLYFNTSKCKCMHIGRNNTNHTYTMTSNGQTSNITECDEEKDLGVIIDNELKFDSHIQEAIKRANRTLGLIKRTFSYLDKEMFLMLYKGLVRPILEYGNVIWSPHLKRQSSAIEKVQRRATKLLPGLKEYNYEDRLKFLKLPSLKARRFRGDIIQCFKIFRGIDDVNVQDLFILSTVKSTRNSSEKIFIQQSRTNLRKFCFTNRVAPIWNKLPTNYKNAQDTNQFKNIIDNWKLYTDIIYSYDA